MATVDGLNEVIRNLQRIRKSIDPAVHDAIEEACIAVVNHIKSEYTDRPAKGKGFETRTGNLRRSITYSVVKQNDRWVGIIHAGEAYAPYAEHVEFISGGKYAFLLPGVWDKKQDILSIINNVLKRKGIA